jgi:alpha-amylase
LDDSHFEAAGYNKQDLFGYYISEEQGYTVAAFPTLSELRQSVLWEPVPTIMEWLREQAEESQQPRLVFVGDDGEKFGVWPGTHERAWGDEQYMEKLFSALEQASDWLTTIRPMDYLDQHNALGRVYLPTASYFEMRQWSLPPERFRELHTIRHELEGRDDIQRYLVGSMWRNFMVKYDEVNQMHKRMLIVARKVHAMPDGSDKQHALDHLWRAQSNDAYWHGLFGGVYLFNFRVENYTNLIAAETLAEGPHAPLTLERLDFSKDGSSEILLTGDPLNAIWKPNLGGMMLELDSRPLRYNVLNVMTRREEGYHDEIRAAAAAGRLLLPDPNELIDYSKRDTTRVKEAGIEQHLIYDWHRRGAFIDHFLPDDTDVIDVYQSLYNEQGDFVTQPYQAEYTLEGGTARITLTRDGHVWGKTKVHSVQVQKQFVFHHGESRFHCEYRLRNQSSVPLSLRFAVELASGFDGGQVLRYCHLKLNDQPEKRSLAAVAEYPAITRHTTVTSIRSLALSTELSQPCALWTYPLETITNSEAGYERGYQGTVYLHVWSLHLNPDTDWNVMIDQQVSAYN